MYEPSASNLGTANLLKHLDNARRSVEKFSDAASEESEAINLLGQLKALVTVAASLDDLATQERRNAKVTAHPAQLSAADLLHLRSVCSSTATITQECVDFIEPLPSRLEDIRGFATTESRLGSQAWYDEIYEGLQLRTEVLRVLLSAINLLRHKNDVDEDDNLSAETLSSASTLQYQIALIKPKLHGADTDTTTVFRKAVAAATGVTLHIPASLNRHFVVGRSPRSFYTGRQTQMARLQAAFGYSTYVGQKVFVIYGLGGSGKTELALKYASDHQQNFWGVFFVDGSSRKNASASYLEIAKIGGVEPNDKAAKNWLTTRALPWLLIIDNVDDSDVQLEELLPVGSKGCILVTSRNPAHKSYGTVGERYLELLTMETEEANELILRAADEPSPWPKSIADSAEAICHALGYLPLALVHAGTAILRRVCPWHEFMIFYERHEQRIRRERTRDRSRSRNRSRFLEDDDYMNVFSSYEILYQSLTSSQEESFKDAVELLHVFSYLHFQNIRFDILINAATNPLKEARQREKSAIEDKELEEKLGKLKRKTWSKWFQEQVLRLAAYLDSPAALPAAMKKLDGLSDDSFKGEVDVRLRMALVVLVSRSLITQQDRFESRYCMHPLVHKWVRQRPEMSGSQQALWCQVASTILANVVLFPPLGDAESERSMRRELLPHIIQVRSCQEEINVRLEENRSNRKSLWPVVKTGFGRLQAVEAARFSRVYSECGLWHETLQLQTTVRDFVTNRLGEEHPLAIQITLFLSGTLLELMRTSEATQLQRRVYEICLKSLGQDHPLTLKVADLLGSSLCFQGRWAESCALHTRAIEGLSTVFGKAHENTLKAIGNLGRVRLRTMEFERASDLQQIAWEGMKKRLGETHVDTLVALEDLAMTRIRFGEGQTLKSHDMMTFVVEQRRKSLGKEQPYTLLAICNLARVKSALGHHEEAARMMQGTLVIAERNLGEEHFGVLAGKAHYAQVLVRLERFAEAEEIFYSIVEKPQYQKSSDEDGEHPDRIIALWYLTGCLEKQGKFQKALEICEGVMRSLQEIGGEGRGMQHKLATMLQEEIEKLKGKMEGNTQIAAGDQNIPGEL